jgi:hypothetical protein
MAAALLESYQQWAAGMDVVLMDWVDPTLRYRQSPMSDYFLADFGTVFALCVGYLTFVVVGTVRLLLFLSLVGRCACKGTKVLTFASLSAPPCYLQLVMKSGMPALNTAPLQFIYNPLQIVLCSYMTVEAILQARRNVRTLPADIALSIGPAN